VNGRDRYEGDYIGRELLLSEILPQQVVLSFRGEKFTMAALSSWH
jgi:general secretion pathway protein A